MFLRISPLEPNRRPLREQDNHHPQVSIVIPFHGRTPEHVALLDETLETVGQQTCTDYEVIVVDDGSLVDVSQMVASHARTRVCHQANAGSAMAGNAGIAASRGENVVFLDADVPGRERTRSPTVARPGGCVSKRAPPG